MAVIVGFSDSICKYLANHATFSPDILFSMHAHPGASVYDLTLDISRHPFVEPDVVFVHVGTNDLPMHRPLSRTVDDFSSLISVAKSRFPSASIIISSILPRFDSEFLNERRFELNSLLFHLCTRQGVFFLDNGNQARRVMFACDALHLSRAGNVSFANYLSFHLSRAVQLHRQRCQPPHGFVLRDEVWPELEDGGRGGKDGEEAAAVDPEKGRMETGAVDQEKKRMETGAVDQEKKRMETGAVDQEKKRMETGAVDQEKKRMETGAVDQEKKRMETGAVDQEKKRMETGAVDQEKKRMETGAVDQEKKRMETGAVDQEKRMETGAVDQEKRAGQGLGQWARVVREGGKQVVSRSRAPRKVEGGSVGRGGPRPREIPVSSPRRVPGKVEGGSVGKRGPRPRETPVSSPRRVPGKVEGGSVGRGGPRPRETPVSSPRRVPGKVEGGSVGKGSPRPRETPVSSPKRVPGKVEGGSTGKVVGHSTGKWMGALMSKREWKKTRGKRLSQFSVAQGRGEVVGGVSSRGDDQVHYVVCPTGWSSCKLRKGRESTGGVSRGQTRRRKVSGKTKKEKYSVANKLEVRMLYSGPLNPSGWVEQIKLKEVGGGEGDSVACEASDEVGGGEGDSVACEVSDEVGGGEGDSVACEVSDEVGGGEGDSVACEASDEVGGGEGDSVACEVSDAVHVGGVSDSQVSTDHRSNVQGRNSITALASVIYPFYFNFQGETYTLGTTDQSIQVCSLQNMIREFCELDISFKSLCLGGTLLSDENDVVEIYDKTVSVMHFGRGGGRPKKSVHPERPCFSVCAYCKKSSIFGDYRHPQGWNEELRKWVDENTNLSSTDSHYIHEEVIKVDRDVVFMTGYDAFCQDLKKNACAFLNGNGGTMFVGVLDNGTVKGVGLTSSQEDDLSRSAHDTIADFLPDVPPSWINVRFVPIMNLELKVVEVHVKAGPIQELYETGDHKVDY
ncbi:uncharacterized protein LOC118422901 [Branchiostoma floridae]|uniref:1-alkyl-2-acetylglycerophosphocholine esterase n=1 Tax=Branchiostoma floridae TaxID=7739 RepID=A0A9J7MYY5_BRAFL|nr:uncharacterized protein LOC118422901 [Branchiostoma floridae]